MRRAHDKREPEVVLTPDHALHAIRATRLPSEIIRLYDELRRAVRLSPPKYSEQADAIRLIERALRSGEIVATRTRMRGDGYLVAPVEHVEVVPPELPPQEELSRLEVTIVDAAGRALDGVDIVWSFDGATRRAVTNRDGRARCDFVRGSYGFLRLANLRRVREIISARGAIVGEGMRDVPAFAVNEEMPDIRVESDRPFAFALTVPIETWFGIELLNGRGDPVPGQAYRLLVPGARAIEGILDAAGKAHIGLDGRVDRPSLVIFPALDVSLFGGDRGASGSTPYVVKQGDCLSTIAHKFGMSWQAVWSDPSNADLRALRKNPNILFPGDIVNVPDKTEKQLPATPNTWQRYVLTGEQAELRLRVRINGRSVSNARYTISVDGNPPRKGVTDAEGRVVEIIAPEARDGELVIDGGPRYRLRLGHLDPIATDSGVQARLAKLGFYFGPIDGALGTYSHAAIRFFQASVGLLPSGEVDDATREALRSAFGC